MGIACAVSGTDRHEFENLLRARQESKRKAATEQSLKRGQLNFSDRNVFESCGRVWIKARRTATRLFFLLHHDFKVRTDLAMKLDRHLEFADNLDRFRQRDLALVHIVALSGESFGNIGGGD